MAIAAAVALAVGGCGDDGDGERSQPSITAPATSSSTTATTPAPEPERIEVEAPPGEPRPDIDVNVTYPSDFTDDQVAVVEAYRGYWHAAYVMNDPCGPTEPGQPAECLPDPEMDAIASFAIGIRLDRVRENARNNRNEGHVLVLPPSGQYGHHILDIDITGDVARLVACSIDDGMRIEASSGTVLDDDIVTRRYQADLTFDGQSWKMAGATLVTAQEWDGEEVETCVAESQP